MAEQTRISWCDSTFNPWVGCQKVGPGCDNCYAEAFDNRFGGGHWGPGAPRRRTGVETWRKPKGWNRAAAKGGKPHLVFCSSLADVFDNAVPTEWRRDLFDLIRATPHLTWMLLTKRPGNILKLFEEVCRLNANGTRWTSELPADRHMWPRNAAIGCTVVNQEEADRDIPKLMWAKNALNPAFTFLSMEPLLGSVDLSYPPSLWPKGPPLCCSGLDCGCAGLPTDPPLLFGIDLVIAGGESGWKARQAELDWFREIRDQCSEWGTRFHLKQLGGRDSTKGGHELDGAEHLDRPRGFE